MRYLCLHCTKCNYDPWMHLAINRVLSVFLHMELLLLLHKTYSPKSCTVTVAISKWKISDYRFFSFLDELHCVILTYKLKTSLLQFSQIYSMWQILCPSFNSQIYTNIEKKKGYSSNYALKRKNWTTQQLLAH